MVNSQAQKAVQDSLDSATNNKASGIPGLVFVAVDRNGEQIAAAASGHKGLYNRDPMTLDTVFWIASCTKLLATIACLQAVEQGLLSLDDHEQVYQLCPELKNVLVLQDDGKLVPKEKEITLRMLLSHTSGFSYEFFSTKLRDHGRPTGYDVFSNGAKDIYRMPLVHQPGEKWEYGIGIDWAGIILERASDIRLNDWIQKHIVQPLGLSAINMVPTDEMKKELAFMQQRWPGAEHTEERDHIYREPLLAETEAEKERLFHSGGAGAFAKPVEYTRVLAALLNNGICPTTGAQVLKSSTVDLMFTNQIPHMPDFGRKFTPAAKPEQTLEGNDSFPQAGNPPQGWGLSFFQTTAPLPTGRGANAVWWAGIANLFWWCDREKGVAGMIASQIMPYGDPVVWQQWMACETEVYRALKLLD